MRRVPRVLPLPITSNKEKSSKGSAPCQVPSYKRKLQGWCAPQKTQLVHFAGRTGTPSLPGRILQYNDEIDKVYVKVN